MRSLLPTLILVACTSGSLIAQKDTVTVRGYFETEGAYGTLNDAIQAARNAGSINSTVFKLNPNERYVLDASIFIDHGESLDIYAPKPGTTQESAPPQIVWTVNDNVDRFHMVRSYGDVRMQNVWLRYADILGNQVSTSVTSDARLKTDIAPLHQGLDEVMLLQPVSYRWKNDASGPVNLGLLAQDVKRAVPQDSTKPHRLIVLTDIEADPDDTQSLVRLLLYANEIDIQGIVATTSVWKKTSVSPESIRKVIRAYGEVQPNLLEHQAGYPRAGALLMLVKEGLPRYGMLGVGDGLDSEGSDWIVKMLDRDDDRPLWISVWGGVNTLAQALHRIRSTREEAEVARLIAKLRVYTISDQDDSGIWIRNQFPDLFYIVSPGDDYGSATWSAINRVVAGIDNSEISNGWLSRNIQQGHGPLGAAYPDVAWGMEGDTPSFLALVPNGLNVPEHPEWGGWGGRYELYQPDFATLKKGGSGVPFEPETRAIWTNAIDTFRPYVPKQYGRAVGRDTAVFSGNHVTLWRWRDDFQNDFAARMDWTVKPYHEANHPPVPVLGHSDRLAMKSGQGFGLDASESTDPDGDKLSFLWFHYPEAGSYKELVNVDGAENAHGAWVRAPEVDKEETLHFILRVTDKGSPPLSRYKRIIVTVTP